ncbi:hypothetical protein HYZ97_02845 [Candidatus Pacearchaeota archaeon]|nr:hypothetical protein [Candidatus Pacearchaeota archaeon]
MNKKHFASKLSALGNILGRGIDNGVDALLRASAKIEKSAQEGTGPIGGLATLVKDAQARYQEFNDDIKARGGYTKVVGEKVSRLEQKIDAYVSAVNARVERDFYTDGKFDDAKVDAFLVDKANAVKVYGEKAITTLQRVMHSGADSVRKEYRLHVPTREEIATKYQGIGSAYEGVLLRDNYEGCLAFHSYAARSIPAGRAYRNQILADIKASASENLAELQAFYSLNEGDSAANRKGTLASGYLTSKKK